MLRRRFLSCTVATLGASLLSGCGFQLRTPRPLPFASLYVGIDRHSELGAALRRKILTSGSTVIVEDPAIADARLEITQNTHDREILSLSAAGKVREYQLFRTLGFRLVSRDNRELIAPTSLTVQRDYNFDDSQIIAKEQEEALLLRDMENDLMLQLLERIAAARP
jgi:LPS-assembly lipoprotein